MVEPVPGLTGLCVGFERGEWRAAAFADFLTESLPDFALTYSEANSFTGQTAVALLRSAAQRVYTTDKFKNRGEFGELILHVILKTIFKTVPAISKLYYKDAENTTVHGFDAVHVVANDDALELWLGEVKFYSDINKALRDISPELEKHTRTEFLRAEFVVITRRLDPAWPHADRLRRLLDAGTSLDQVFAATCVPVLLTYDGDATDRFSEDSAEYRRVLMEELTLIHKRFVESGLPPDVRIHLFLIPLKTKALLLEVLDRKLKAWQTI